MNVAFSVTQFGEPLSKDKYIYDPDKSIFSTNENHLVIDFAGVSGFTITVGNTCVISAGYGNTFKTGICCTFDVSHSCAFDVGNNCVIIRKDTLEIIKPKVDKPIKLNEFRVKGFKKVIQKRIVVLDDKEFAVGPAEYNQIKSILDKLIQPVVKRSSKW